jgi:hypothetical protein
MFGTLWGFGSSPIKKILQTSMNKQDQRVQFFLQLFLLATGCNIAGFNIWKITTDFWISGLFEFHLQELPVFWLVAGLIVGFTGIFAALFLWMRTTWAYSFSLLVTGLLFTYTLFELGTVVFSMPYHAIPLSIILFVVMQTIPFLMRRTQRQL